MLNIMGLSNYRFCLMPKAGCRGTTLAEALGKGRKIPSEGLLNCE
jgi:hypothetical protein